MMQVFSHTRTIAYQLLQKIRDRKRIRTFVKRYKQYLEDGMVQDSDQSVLREAAIATGGMALDWAFNTAITKYPKWALMEKNSKLLNLDEEDYRAAEKSLWENGYWVSPSQVTSSLLDAFQNSAIEELGNILGNDTTSNPEIMHKESHLNSKEMIFLGSEWVLSQKLTYLLATSSEVLNIVGRYLRVQPILNLPESWFSFPVQKIDSSSPQNWHFDCDRVKWLKVFVYLNDVNETNGPHSYIATSHRNWRLKSRTSRYLEDDVRKVFKEIEFMSFKAPRGTVIFEDTRGLHKGSRLIDRHRLILQLEYSIDSFGYLHPPFRIPVKYSSFQREFGSLFPSNRFIVS